MESMEHKLAFFKENGYYVEHGALQPDEVAQVIAGIEDVGGNSSDVIAHIEEKASLAPAPASNEPVDMGVARMSCSPLAPTALLARATRLLNRPQLLPRKRRSPRDLN